MRMKLQIFALLIIALIPCTHANAGQTTDCTQNADGTCPLGCYKSMAGCVQCNPKHYGGGGNNESCTPCSPASNYKLVETDTRKGLTSNDDCATEGKTYKITLNNYDGSQFLIVYEKYGTGFSKQQTPASWFPDWQDTWPKGTTTPNLYTTFNGYKNSAGKQIITKEGRLHPTNTPMDATTFTSDTDLTPMWKCEGNYTVNFKYTEDDVLATDPLDTSIQCTVDTCKNEYMPTSTNCTIPETLITAGYNGYEIDGWTTNNSEQPSGTWDDIIAPSFRILPKPQENEVTMTFDLKSCSIGYYCLDNNIKEACPPYTISDIGAKSESDCFYTIPKFKDLNRDTQFNIPALDSIKLYYQIP